MSTPEIKLKNVTQIKEYVVTVEGIEGRFIIKRTGSSELRVTKREIVPGYFEPIPFNISSEYEYELFKAIIKEFSKHI